NMENLKLKVLIVDDEVELRKSVQSFLENMTDFQFELDEAENGKIALEKVQNNQFDIVLMDVRMPEMNGIETLKAIKEHDPRIFVLLMTAHSNLADAVESIKHGAYDYVPKPVHPEKLKEVIKKAIDAREMVSTLA